MREIILTGLTKKEFMRKKDKGSVSCYLCKRKPDDMGVFVSRANNSFHGNDINLGVVSVIKKYEEDTKLEFFICNECAMFLEAVIDSNVMKSLVSGT